MDVPADYARRLRCIRRQLGLTQQQLAAKIRAARKAVVYQWESGKRRPSPVFWQRIQDLRADAVGKRLATCQDKSGECRITGTATEQVTET